MQPQCPNERSKGQNKLFQNASLLMCYCSLAIGQFLILKNLSERQAIELLFKDTYFVIYGIISEFTDKRQFHYLTKLKGPQVGNYL